MGTAVPPSPDIPRLNPPGRVGLIGAGAFGRFCLDAYRQAPDIVVDAVADPNPAALSLIGATSGVRRSESWADILADDEIEAVHLATPPGLRGTVARAAIEAGKSVFCEKPLALTLSDADAMIAAARRNQVALGVDYVMRHLPAYHVLYALAASGALGALQTVSLQNFAQVVPPGHWFWDRAQSGGILVEHGVHFFDAYGHIAGVPHLVSGDMPRPGAIEVMVTYAGGAVGRFYHEFAFPRQVERTVGIAFFQRGYVEIEGWIPERLSGAVLAPPEALHQVAADLQLPLTVAEDEVSRFALTFADRAGSYQAAIVSGMRDTIRHHRDPAHAMEVSADEARASLVLALAGQEAADRGQTVTVSGRTAPVV